MVLTQYRINLLKTGELISMKIKINNQRNSRYKLTRFMVTFSLDTYL